MNAMRPLHDSDLFHTIPVPTQASQVGNRHPDFQALMTWNPMLKAIFGVMLAIIGAQKGDEGKGKVVAWAAKVLRIMLMVRFQGGGNAGHQITLTIEGVEKEVSFHHIPEGLAFGGYSAIGAGCVMHPQKLVAEILKLEKAGIPIRPDRLFIDPRVSVATFYEMEAATVVDGGSNAIGSTKSCIAETYMAVAGKYSITVWDCVNERNDHALLRRALHRNRAAYGDRKWVDQVEFDEAFKTLVEFGRLLKKHATICRVDYLVQAWQNDGGDIGLVGGQGGHLDVLSSRPTATSSHIWPPLGIGPVDNVVRMGMAKLLPTCAGKHVVPTIRTGEEIDTIRKERGEYGKTTGRPYTLHEVMAERIRETVRRFGLHGIIFNKMDLDTGEVRVHAGLQVDGLETLWWASELEMWDVTQPGQASERINFDRVTTLPALSGQIAGITDWNDLPPSVYKRLLILEMLMLAEVPIIGIGNGPRPADVVVRRADWESPVKDASYQTT